MSLRPVLMGLDKKKAFNMSEREREVSYVGSSNSQLCLVLFESKSVVGPLCDERVLGSGSAREEEEESSRSCPHLPSLATGFTVS